VGNSVSGGVRCKSRRKREFNPCRKKGNYGGKCLRSGSNANPEGGNRYISKKGGSGRVSREKKKSFTPTASDQLTGSSRPRTRKTPGRKDFQLGVNPLTSGSNNLGDNA